VDDIDRISLDEAARIFHVGKSTLFDWLRTGKLRRYKRRGDRRTFVSRRDLERFLEFREA
jgi:excisionase family DNA binding protein